LTDRVLPRKEVVGDGLPDDDDARGRAHIRLGEEVAALNRPLAYLGELLGDALNAGAPVMVACDELRARVDDGADEGDARHFAPDGFEVFDRERVGARVARAAADAADVLRACTDEEQVGAHALYLRLHGGLRALTDADHHDDGRDADDDAEHGQRRAGLVARQRAEGDADNH
jgi:hypothetical protein